MARLVYKIATRLNVNFSRSIIRVEEKVLSNTSTWEINIASEEHFTPEVRTNVFETNAQ